MTNISENLNEQFHDEMDNYQDQGWTPSMREFSAQFPEVQKECEEWYMANYSHPNGFVQPGLSMGY